MQKGLVGDEWVDVCMSLQSTDWVPVQSSTQTTWDTSSAIWKESAAGNHTPAGQYQGKSLFLTVQRNAFHVIVIHVILFTLLVGMELFCKSSFNFTSFKL